MAAIFQTIYSMHFLEWKRIRFDQDFIKVCSQWSSEQYFSICLDDGLAPATRKAIIWTTDG